MQQRAQYYFGKNLTVTLPSATAHSWLCLEERMRWVEGDRERESKIERERDRDRAEKRRDRTKTVYKCDPPPQFCVYLWQ